MSSYFVLEMAMFTAAISYRSARFFLGLTEAGLFPGVRLSSASFWAMS